MKFWYEIQKGRFDFISCYLWIFAMLSLFNKSDFFFAAGGGGARRLEGFIKCLELPFNVEKFKKQRTPDLSKQSTCRSSCGWNHIFLLHLSNYVAGREPEAYRLNLHVPWNRRGQSHLLSYRKESK